MAIGNQVYSNPFAAGRARVRDGKSHEHIPHKDQNFTHRSKGMKQSRASRSNECGSNPQAYEDLSSRLELREQQAKDNETRLEQALSQLEDLTQNIREADDSTQAEIRKISKRLTKLEKRLAEFKPSVPPTSFNHLTLKGRKKLKERFERDIEESSTKPEVDWGDKKPVIVIESKECTTVGWERQLQTRVRERLDSGKSLNVDPTDVIYFPGRLISFENRNAVVLGVKSQTNKEHRFTLTSPLDGLLGQEKEVLLDGEDEAGEVFYGGRYRFLPLDRANPAGYVFDGPESSISKLRPLVVASEAGQAKLSNSDISTFIRDGIIQFEFIGLQLVGWNSRLNRRLTKAEKSGTDMPTVQLEQTTATSELSISYKTQTKHKRPHRESSEDGEMGPSMSQPASKRARQKV
ncbi:hypothetical protein PQX77_007322 [Marasmius sp. AFHP31]|nr:hypothetical protein PQX77_007322 [Marasmius sp. AFHP31]